MIDNAKALVIVLVVVGHALAPMRSVDLADVLYTWIYVFHMPAFVLMSGFLSRRWTPDARRLARLVGTLLVPYVVFQLVHAGIRAAELREAPSLDLFRPAWTLWFLLALAAWRLAAPLLRALRARLVVAVGVALLAGLSDVDQTLSAARFLGLLPFFVLGLVLRPEHLALLRRPSVRAVAGGVLLGGLALVALVHDRVPTALLYHDRPFADVGLDPGAGLLLRSALLVAGAVAGFAVLAVVPGRRTWWTYLGGATLTVYLLHAVVLQPMRDGALAAVTTAPGAIATVAGAVALALLLGTDAVRRATRWLVEPRVDRLVRPDP